jgi:hypothetical protein
MAPKRLQIDVYETPRTYYLISKIPNHPEDDYFIDEVLDDPGLAGTLVEGGLANLFVWLSVIGLGICTLYYPPGQTGTSLAFSVRDDKDKDADSLIGDHENYDKMGICTTLVKLAFTHESELLKAGEMFYLFAQLRPAIDPTSL